MLYDTRYPMHGIVTRPAPVGDDFDVAFGARPDVRRCGGKLS
jgi:hypothetical protein